MKKGRFSSERVSEEASSGKEEKRKFKREEGGICSFSLRDALDALAFVTWV